MCILGYNISIYFVGGEHMVNLMNIIVDIPIALVAIIGHELGHAWVSTKLGDPTPRYEGRLTLNPLAHLDPIGTLLMIFTGFGWARPVGVNPMYYKDRKKGMALVAIAGPLSNFILAFFCFLAVIVGNMSQGLANNVFFTSFSDFMVILANLSIGLGVFNLIPVPPLDGSNIIFPFLPNGAKKFMYEYGQYIQFALLALLMFNVLDGVLYAMRSIVFDGILAAVIFIVELFV